MKLHILLVSEDILRFISGKLTSPFFCSPQFSNVSFASFVGDSDYLFIYCWNLVALRLTVLILMSQSKVLDFFFINKIEIQNFLLEYFILPTQNWKCSWCKLMCLSMMLLNFED